MSTQRQRLRDTWWVLWPALVGIFTIWTFFFIGEDFLAMWTLDVGAINAPRPLYARFLLFYTFFGVSAAGFLGLAMARLLSHRARNGAAGQPREPRPDSWWIVGGTIAGAVVPLLIQRFVLEGAHLTDDESCYQFMGEVLASGRLTAVSPPMKEFYDHTFMINDGRLYAMYFIGWPALRVPGEWLGIADYMNLLYSALTVPALFLVVRRMSSNRWAKVATVIYLLAPHLMIVAATQMAHTSCIAALAWFSWFVLRARDEDAPWWTHAGVGLLFSVAFFIRPLDAVGVGLPLLVYWAWGFRDAAKRTRVVNAVAFLVPALVMASLFLGVNEMQNGSPFTVAYQRDMESAMEFGAEATTYAWLEDELGEIPVPHFAFEYPVTRAFASTGLGLLRLNISLLGWPLSLIFVLFALRRHEERLWWASALFQLALLFFVLDPGIDSFGPPHYTSIGWPLLLLSVLGIRSLTDRLRAISDSWNEGLESKVDLGYLPLSVVCAFALVSMGMYVPNRFATLNDMAIDINRPVNAVAEAGLHHAVIFTAAPFAPPCQSDPARHFVSWRPNNDPDLENDILWVNHFTLEQDREYMRETDRKGYVLAYYGDCEPAILPLDELEKGDLPEVQYR